MVWPPYLMSKFQSAEGLARGVTRGRYIRPPVALSIKPTVDTLHQGRVTIYQIIVLLVLQGSTMYISSDMFYVEIQCDISPTNRSVREVRVAHHSSQPTSSPAMTAALRQANAPLFMEHIKGFLDMYNIENE